MDSKSCGFDPVSLPEVKHGNTPYDGKPIIYVVKGRLNLIALLVDIDLWFHSIQNLIHKLYESSHAG